MSSITDESNVLDNNFLSGLVNEDQDILDEFLDQRVYDSLGSLNMGSQVKLEADGILDNLYYGDTTQSSGVSNLTKQQAKFAQEHDDVSNITTPSNNDYLYADPINHQDLTSGSIYASPYENKAAFIKNSPNSSIGDNNESIDIAMKDSQSDQFTDYDGIREELSKLKFGNHNMNPCPETVEVPDPSYLDFSPEMMAKLPYNLELSNLPTYSRVETQIKIKFTISPPPPQTLLHIPQDLISKNKFCLNDPISNVSQKLKENLLYLDTYVFTSNFKTSCNICSRCIKREQKRASRRKSGANGNEPELNPPDLNYNGPNSSGVVKNNPRSWADENMMKKAIIFNCKEVVSFPPPSGLSSELSKYLELSARIICYCRHHKESEGFRLLFVLKNNKGEVVAKQISSQIMIMDRKKNTASGNVKQEENLSNSVCGSSTNLQSINNTHINNEFPNSIHPLSPNSIDESASEPTNTDTNGDSRGLKRKKLSFDDSHNSSTNPMFNGSINGFSPTSNSDTNTSASNVLKQAVSGNISSALGLSPLNQPLLNTQSALPSIQRIIPAQGPVRGGIEVTLLGFNFRPDLQVKFGSNQALATHCWSETTIVTYLPPAAQPGQVLVSFENHENMMGAAQQHQIFTYTDDTDRQLIELALQIVGLKMNGKLEDAKNIAKRIVGSDTSGANSNAESPNPINSKNVYNANIEWYDNAHKAVQELTKSNLSTEEILINFISLVDLPNCPIIIPNWQLCNSQGQTMLHLATLKGYKDLIKFLFKHGCKMDIKDNQGLTPLFFASMCGNRDLIKIFIECKSNWNLKLSNDKYLKDYCDLNVLDVFNNLEENLSEDKEFADLEKDEIIPKSVSLDSLSSMFAMDYTRHISKMVNSDLSEGSIKSPHRNEYKQDVFSYDDSNYNSDFADFEFDSSDSDLSNNEIEDNGELENNSNVRNTLLDHNKHNEINEDMSLWSKVKKVFNNENEGELPTYEDLFPFGPASSHAKPKSTIERNLNESTEESAVLQRLSSTLATDQQDDAGITSDSSEDMALSYINHPRKSVENDKMLLFFWFPVLICILGLFFCVSVMGYRIEHFETIKNYSRNALGNLMVGNERLGRVFKNNVGV